MQNKRYTLNILFKTNLFEKTENIVAHFKTLKDLEAFSDIIDETVGGAFIKDNVTNKITWLKGQSL